MAKLSPKAPKPKSARGSQVWWMHLLSISARDMLNIGLCLRLRATQSLYPLLAIPFINKNLSLSTAYSLKGVKYKKNFVQLLKIKLEPPPSAVALLRVLLTKLSQNISVSLFIN
jgi:hypothetical protein